MYLNLPAHYSFEMADIDNSLMEEFNKKSSFQIEPGDQETYVIKDFDPKKFNASLEDLLELSKIIKRGYAVIVFNYNADYVKFFIYPGKIIKYKSYVFFEPEAVIREDKYNYCYLDSYWDILCEDKAITINCFSEALDEPLDVELWLKLKNHKGKINSLEDAIVLYKALKITRDI